MHAVMPCNEASIRVRWEFYTNETRCDECKVVYDTLFLGLVLCERLGEGCFNVSCNLGCG